jgi:hypothetical protein
VAQREIDDEGPERAGGGGDQADARALSPFVVGRTIIDGGCDERDSEHGHASCGNFLTVLRARRA